jgi:hypothetical protein
MSVDFDDGMAIRLDGFRRNREEGANTRLLDVLRFLRAYQCEDFRDKIYAALGMAMDINEDDIIPDYTKPYPVVCQDLACFLMSRSSAHSLDFLGTVLRLVPGTAFVRESVNMDFGPLPSWVPDWSIRISMFPFEKRLYPDTYDESPLAYHASGSYQSICKAHQARLFIQGSLVDKIARVWSICEWNLAAAGFNLEEQWIPVEPDKLYRVNETMMQAFNHTIVADLGRKDTEDDAAFSRNMAMDWDFAKRHRDTLTTQERQRQSWMLIGTKMMTFGRRLFETERGLLGLGPAAADAGDQVCVFAGGQVLYVVRSVANDEHEFIGECYVHGMMDGEACDEPSFKLQEMVLV